MQSTLTLQPFPRKLMLAVLAGILLVLAVLAGLTIYERSRPVFVGAGGQRIPISKAIEDRYGIRLTFVGLTARDGFIDVRYRVIDAEKAVDFGHYTETTPYIIAEDSGEKITVTEMGLHNHRMQPGLIFHVMYRNTANAIEHGRPVTIQVGDMAIKHIIVQ